MTTLDDLDLTRRRHERRHRIATAMLLVAMLVAAVLWLSR